MDDRGIAARFAASASNSFFSFQTRHTASGPIVELGSGELILLLTAIGLSPGGSGYFTCKQNMKLVTTKFKSGGLHEKHVVATGNVGNRLSVCFWAQGNQEKPVSGWPVAGPSEY